MKHVCIQGRVRFLLLTARQELRKRDYWTYLCNIYRLRDRDFFVKIHSLRLTNVELFLRQKKGSDVRGGDKK